MCVYKIFKAELAYECLRKQSKSNMEDTFFCNSHQIQHSSTKHLNFLALENAFPSAPGEY